MNAVRRPNPVAAVSLIRAGIPVLPRGAALKLVGNLGTFHSIGYGVPQHDEAATVVTPAFFVGELVGSVLPVTLTPFAVFALFAYLLPFGHRRAATPGLVCTLLGAGVTLATLGVVNYAIPVLGHAYLNGDAGRHGRRGQLLHLAPRRHDLPGLLVPAGAILSAVAIGRSTPVPVAAACLFAFATSWSPYRRPCARSASPGPARACRRGADRAGRSHRPRPWQLAAARRHGPTTVVGW